MVARASMTAIYRLLRERFGHEAFQPGQEELVARLLGGGDVVAEFAAGSGERLCYQLLTYLWEQPTLVVSPQRGSLWQEVERMHRKGLSAEVFDAAIGRGTAEAIGSRLQSRQLRLLYITGEGLHHPALRRMLEGVEWALVVLEQAQQACASSSQYRPGWHWAFQQVRGLRAERKLYLAETGSAGALAELIGAVAGATLVRGAWWRPNVALHAALVDPDTHAAAVLSRLAGRPAGAALICCTGPERAEAMAAAISAAGRAARTAHPNMKPQARQAACEWYLASEQPVLVTAGSIVALPHRADLRAVYLCHLPSDAHELLGLSSRAGRDGLPAVCEVLLTPYDGVALENQIRAAVPDLSALQAFLEELFSGPQQNLLSKQQAAHRYDLPLRAVEDTLDWLASQGLLAEGATSPREIRFKCLEPLPRIVQRFQGERADFLKRVFGTARRARTWHYLDLQVAEVRLAESYERAVTALQYLGRRGLLELHSSQVQTHIHRVASHADASHAARRVREQLICMRDQRLRTAQAMRTLFSHSACWLQRLGAYLGYSTDRPCGTCTWCTSGRPLPPDARHVAMPETLPENLWERLRDVQAQHAKALAPPAAAARFLCGISTPRLVQQRLTRHPLFGACRHVPVGEVYRKLRERGMHPAAAG